jgi:hypothetical protein
MGGGFHADTLGHGRGLKSTSLHDQVASQRASRLSS